MSADSQVKRMRKWFWSRWSIHQTHPNNVQSERPNQGFFNFRLISGQGMGTSMGNFVRWDHSPTSRGKKHRLIRNVKGRNPAGELFHVIMESDG
jgi:hypothetical protein